MVLGGMLRRLGMMIDERWSEDEGLRASWSSAKEAWEVGRKGARK